jgi:hypothetical protein
MSQLTCDPLLWTFQTVATRNFFYYDNLLNIIKQEFISYNEDSKISSQPIFSYNQHFGEEPLHFHVEPPETVSSHKLEYYEVCYLIARCFICFGSMEHALIYFLKKFFNRIIWTDKLICFVKQSACICSISYFYQFLWFSTKLHLQPGVELLGVQRPK